MAWPGNILLSFVQKEDRTDLKITSESKDADCRSWVSDEALSQSHSRYL